MARVKHRRQLSFGRYRGKLSLPEIAHGISACIASATERYRDAKLLHAAGRGPGAFATYLLSQQEAGKVWILQRMTLLDDHDEDAWHELWKDFCWHSAKNLAAMRATAGASYDPDGPSLFWSALEYDRDRSEPMEQARQLGLYVEFIEQDRDWWTPRDITEELVGLAEKETRKIIGQLTAKQDVGFFTVRALEIRREEFKGWKPDIEIGKSYDEEDFGERVIGLKGPYKRFLRRLLAEGVISPEKYDMRIMGQSLEDFLW